MSVCWRSSVCSTTPKHPFLFFLLLPLLLHTAEAQPFDYPTANLSSKWTNTPDLPHTISYPDGSLIKALLLRQTSAIIGPSFACGFYCRNVTTTTTTTPIICDSFLFAIFIVYVNSGGRITLPTTGIPPVVWSANRNRPIRENATLEFTQDGNLILKDVDGSPVWSTGTSGQSVLGMNLTENGNLVLVGGNGKVVWQSFDHPTDAIVPGQKLMDGQRITANTSATNWTEGQFYLSATSGGWNAFVDSTPPQLYYSHGSTSRISNGNNPGFVQFTNGSIRFFDNSSYSDDNSMISLPPITSAQYMRLEFDGHLRVYGWDDTGGWTTAGWVDSGEWRIVRDVMDNYYTNRGVCSYPTVCGNYGLCNGGQCSCPKNDSGSVDYFKLLNNRESNLGCAQITPLSCQALQDHRFLTLSDVSYFNYIDGNAITSNLTTRESCKDACLRKCSCKAAFFQYEEPGSCYLLSQVFSMTTIKPDSVRYSSTAYIKVQASPVVDAPPGLVDAPSPGFSLTSESKSISVPTIVGSVLGALLGLSIIIGIVVVFMKRRNRSDEEVEDDEDHIDQLPGMTTRFSYEELKVATDNFFKKLGEGGFGAVFEGTLTDGTKIAVKRLDNVGQGKREFLSEVETIGSIHHVHLVRLVGFCTWRSHRLLVYEYMSNGSLDKWIFRTDKSEHHLLDWQTKCKIIKHVAKGLLYLHEECRQRIAHLDIKPQNILLDHNFDAKVSDFGLSKLIERDQSAVMTRMRGTPGYLAPEWLTSAITEKVDVYSYGVVIIEVVCGRKNLDYSKPEESVHLLRILKEKAEQGKMSDFVEEYSHQSAEVDLNEVEKMLLLAIWCLQSDTDRRPSMSSVVKVLEGSLDVDPWLDYNNLWTMGREVEHKVISGSSNQSAPLLASVLSGPR